MKLPSMAGGDGDINKLSDALIVRIGGFKNMMLPRQAASSESVKQNRRVNTYRLFLKEKIMAKKNDEGTTFTCPVGSFFMDLEKVFGKKSKFVEHFGKSQVEFLKAVRSLIDERIERVEKKGSSSPKKETTKIKVE